MLQDGTGRCCELNKGMADPMRNRRKRPDRREIPARTQKGKKNHYPVIAEQDGIPYRFEPDMEFRSRLLTWEQQVGNRFTVDLEITAELGEVASEDRVEKRSITCWFTKPYANKCASPSARSNACR